MIGRIKGLFQRYAGSHLRADGPGFDLRDELLRQVGRVDLVQVRGNRLRVAGWAVGAEVTLHAGTARTTMRPTLPRTDVGERMGIAPEVGFDMQVPRSTLPPGLLPMLQLRGQTGARPLFYGITPPPLGRARLRVMLGFTRAFLRSVPLIARWKLRGDAPARDRAKVLLGLDFAASAQVFDPGIFGLDAEGQPLPRASLPATAPTEAGAVAIIMPVYNAFDILGEVVDRVLAHTDLPFTFIIVEDCSPDARVRPFLQERAAGEARIELIENAANLGFIGSVNRGLARAAELGRHAILLNSDAFVPAGWASRLLAPILDEPSHVATVTPMSNDAEIFGTPALCRQHPLEPGMADRIDKTAATLSPRVARAEVPTGMGYCMAMNRVFLAKVPTLDPIFGKGYGEEVDWCRRTAALGGVHLGIGTLYVEHRGGESFGSAAKLALVAKNNALINRRHPGYDARVQEFITADPLLSPRLALAGAWAGAWSDARAAAGAEEARVPIYLAHALGGGAENWLQARIKADQAETGRPAIILRVGGLHRWQVEIYSHKGVVIGTCEETEVMRRILVPIRRREVVYSCGVGDGRAPELPAALLSLGPQETQETHDAPEIQADFEVLIHDFFPLSPSYTLLDSDGLFHGVVPAGQEATADTAHRFTWPGGSAVLLDEWRAEWGRLMQACTRITTFSEDSAAHVRTAYPAQAAKVVVVPHTLLHPVPQLTVPSDGPRTIGVLGNIGYQKGAAIVAALGRSLTGPGAPRLVIVGNVDPGYPPPAQVRVHGDYDLADLPALASDYNIGAWLIPSIWPETFSYTTHEALATGLPVYAFALGAQGEAVGKAANGILIAFDANADLAEAAAAALTAPT